MTKISKILLPLSTFAAATTIVTPCLTSCSKKGVWDEAVDLKEFKPDSKTQHEAKTLTAAQAAEALFGSKNSKSLAEQDILYFLQSSAEAAIITLIAYLGFLTTPEQVESELCSISNVKINYKTGNNFARLSGTIRLKFVCTMLKMDLEDPYAIGTYTLETKHEIHNLPYYVTKGTSNHWGTNCSVNGSLSSLENDKEWYVDRSYEGIANYYKSTYFDEKESQSIRYTCLNVPEEGETLPTLDEILFKLVYWSDSYHLYKCN